MTATLVKLATPDVQPVALADLKAHVKVDHNAEDDDLQAKLDAATQIVEDRIGRSLAGSTWRYELGGDFPADDLPLSLPLAIASVTSAVYDDVNGDEQTLTADTDYTVDTRSDPGRLLRVTAEGDWPIAGDVRITFVESTPKAAVQAILLLAGHLYRDREGGAWPDAVERLIQQLVGVMIN